MIYFMGSDGQNKHVEVSANLPGLSVGKMLSPAMWRNPYCTYACDNDVYANRSDTGWWCREGESKWFQMLDKIPADREPLFCVLPDVVGDWETTLFRARQYRVHLATRNLRAAIALQDGIEDLDECLIAHPDAVFVGGSTRWKWLNVERITTWAHGRGLWVHVGRVNGPNAFRECLRLRVNSCDGTGVNRFPDEMLPPLRRVLEATPTPTLFD